MAIKIDTYSIDYLLGYHRQHTNDMTIKSAATVSRIVDITKKQLFWALWKTEDNVQIVFTSLEMVSPEMENRSHIGMNVLSFVMIEPAVCIMQGYVILDSKEDKYSYHYRRGFREEHQIEIRFDASVLKL